MQDDNRNDVKRIEHTVLSLLFVGLLAVGFLFSMVKLLELLRNRGSDIKNVAKIMNEESEDKKTTSFSGFFESKYANFFSRTEMSLDVFSLSQVMLGKHETRSFEVLKANDGELYLRGNEGAIDIDNLQMIADQYSAIFEATQYYGGHFLYVQVPYKNVDQAPELIDYAGDNVEESEDYLVGLLQERGIPVLDLRNYDECKQYYKTDHHWTIEAAFHSSAVIANEIENVYGIDLVGHEYYGDINNYNPTTYENSFLGSIGIKVGPYYTGKDDFTVYDPKFETDFNFKHYQNGLQFEYSGEFMETFLDREKLENSKYNNKYDTNMRAAYESVINNNLAQNDYKGLLISHSYGRSMAQYMCFDYSELRALDPQRGRYNGNLVEYIQGYQPDVVVLMYNSLVNIGDGNWEN